MEPTHNRTVTARLAGFPIVALLFLTAAVCGVCDQGAAPALAAEDRPVETVESSPGTAARIYRIVDRDCTISWVVYTTELNRGVVKCSTRCPLPLSRQIFETFLEKDVDAPSSEEMPLRLALATHNFRDWDARRGKPRAGDTNRFVRDLANRVPIYPELKEVFEPASRRLSIASVEKVRVLEAERLPFYDKLGRAGVATTERLPFDCMVWFSVSK